MIEMGLIVGIALIISMAKASWFWRMKLLSNPAIADLVIFTLLVILHWGTFSGVMVATIGALTCSVILSAGRKAFGYYLNGDYVRGIYDVANKL